MIEQRSRGVLDDPCAGHDEVVWGGSQAVTNIWRINNGKLKSQAILKMPNPHQRKLKLLCDKNEGLRKVFRPVPSKHPPVAI